MEILKRSRFARLIISVFVIASFALVFAPVANATPNPTTFTLTPQVHALKATWGLSGTEAELKDWKIKERPVTEPASAWSKAIELAKTAREYTYTGLEHRLYEVKLVAYNAEGKAAGSAHAQATPLEEEVTFETWEDFTAENPMPAARTVWASTSAFNTLVPSNPEVLSNSAEMVTFLGSPQDLWTDGGFDHPWYYAKESDPLDEIKGVEFGTWANGLKIHIPAVAKPAPGSDHHMGVVEKNGEVYDFWSVQKEGPVGGVLEAHGAGYASNFGTSSGVSEKEDGATASGFNIASGVIRPEELAAGHINHALFIPVYETRKECHVAPAKGTDGKSTNVNSPCQGQRFYLTDTDAEIEAKSVAPWKKTILKAMHEYGLYVGDSGDNPWGLKLEGWQDRGAYGLGNPFNAYLDGQAEITKETGKGGASDTMKLAGGWELSHLRAIK